jgi:dihydroxyacetone kinase-like predicted kinase
VTYLNGPGAAATGAGGHRVLAFADGAGLVQLLRDAGAVVVESEEGAARDSGVPDVVRSAEAKIIIMPNKSHVAVAARAAGRQSPVFDARADRQVIEIGSAVQAIAALAVHDPGRDLDDDAAAMRRAVAGMRHASVARLARERPGAIYVGRIGDEVVARGGGQAAVAVAVLDRLLAPGAELVTMLSGQAGDPGLAELAAAHVRRLIPAAEVACYDGGMADAVLLIGAE